MGVFTGLMDSPAGKGLLERFHRALLGPPTLFWLAVVLSWVCAYPEAAIEAFHKIPEPSVWLLALTGLVAAVLLLLAAWISDTVRDDLYRWLEGYRWPAWAFRWGVYRWENKRDRMMDDWSELVQDGGRGDVLDPARARSIAALDSQLHRLPQNNLLPTAFGNTLRAAEEYVRTRYGLDPVVVWPRLWLLLSEERDELDSHRRALDAAVDGFLFGILLLFLGVVVGMLLAPPGWLALLLLVFGSLFLWFSYRRDQDMGVDGFLFGTLLILLGAAVELIAVPGASLAPSGRVVIPLFVFGLLFTWFSYRLAVERTMQFAVLLQATFDVGRLRLYDALGCPRPRPAAEKDAGRWLSAFLWRGDRPPCSGGNAVEVRRASMWARLSRGRKRVRRR